MTGTLQIAAFGMRRSAITSDRLGVRNVLCCSAFPLAPALRSTNSAADRSALFASFKATMTEPDVPRSCIIGDGSSPFRCGPWGQCAQRSNAGPPRFRRSPFERDWVSTTAERQPLAKRDRTCCLRRCLPARPLRVYVFRGSIANPTQSLCTLRCRRCRRHRNTHYRAPATAYPDRSLTGRTAPACLAHKQSMSPRMARWIASLRSQ